MTDPRILECARAAQAFIRTPLPNVTEPPTVIDLRSVSADSLGDVWAGIARAVILRWLEQGATEGMLEASCDPIWKFSSEYATIDKDPTGSNEDSAEWVGKNTYAAMCAQARKELSK